jgi:Ion channel
MKRIVDSIWWSALLIAALTYAVVVLTGVGFGAIVPVATGFGAILIAVWRLQEDPPKTWRKLIGR